MEVHHHPALKHERKKWKEYLLEFLMIFIAVTLGFFAEGLRENISEKHIEKDYIESFIADLKTDTTRLALIIPAEKKAISAIDTLLIILNLPSYSDDNTRRMYYLFRKYTMSFEPMTFNLRTYTQLKNSGGLRLIKSKAASDSIVAYNKIVDDITSIINFTTHDFMLPAIYQGNKIFDSRYLLPYGGETIDSMLNTDTKVHLLTKNTTTIAEYSNLLYQVKHIRTSYLKQLVYHKERAKNMIDYFQQEYKTK